LVGLSMLFAAVRRRQSRSGIDHIARTRHVDEQGSSLPASPLLLLASLSNKQEHCNSALASHRVSGSSVTKRAQAFAELRYPRHSLDFTSTPPHHPQPRPQCSEQLSSGPQGRPSASRPGARPQLLVPPPAARSSSQSKLHQPHTSRQYDAIPPAPAWQRRRYRAG
jgi:hypothetical protein